MSLLRISELHVYPIKSARGISLSTAQLEERGLRYDRHWMVVDDHGHFLTQRKLPRMALLHVEIRSDHLKVSAEGREDLHVPLQSPSSDHLRVQVWDDCLDALDSGTEAASWLTEMLRQPCRLVSMPDNVTRTVNPKYSARKSPIHFADAFPLLLISQASLDDLNGRLAAPVPMNRFRPNLVVDGSSPYEEDTWKELRIGSITFRVAKPCSRCTVPTVDQDTGERGVEPIQTLRSYRARDGKVFFGQNLVHEGLGILSVGDSAEAQFS